MRYFPLQDLEYLLLALFLGAIALCVILLAYPSPRKKEKETDIEEFPDGIRATNRPIPPILVFVYSAFGIWAVVYMLMIGVFGKPF